MKKLDLPEVSSRGAVLDERALRMVAGGLPPGWGGDGKTYQTVVTYTDTQCINDGKIAVDIWC